MSNTSILPDSIQESLSAIAETARRQYLARMRGEQVCWWTTVILTASSSGQAEGFAEEIRRRHMAGSLPADVPFLVVPDLDGKRIGSGGATLNALRALAESALTGDTSPLAAWWQRQRVLILHAGGDAQRLPQYSLTGKLFSPLPVYTPWGDVSTVFDEVLIRSTAWAARLPAGLVVASGDTLLTFDADLLCWDRPGVCGVAMRLPIEVGSRHGVYITDADGAVRDFLQKPTPAQAAAAGGLFVDRHVALDTGLLSFDATVAARLTALAGVARRAGIWRMTEGILDKRPSIDLYEHITYALCGKWTPDRGIAWQRRLARALRGIPFWCDLVAGDFTHCGATPLFRQLMTEGTDLTRLYPPHLRMPADRPVDSVLTGGYQTEPGAVILDCHLAAPVHVRRGAILHGLTGITRAVTVPENTVFHQAPVTLPDGSNGVVLRVFGVEDDPKQTVASGNATWLGQPILALLATLGLDPECVWPDLPHAERTLWNAALFPLGQPDEVWDCARWFTGIAHAYSLTRWHAAGKLSLATSARWADHQTLTAWHEQRRQTCRKQRWAEDAVECCPRFSRWKESVIELETTARRYAEEAPTLETREPTEAASRYALAARCWEQAGQKDAAARAREAARACIRRAVDVGVDTGELVYTRHMWSQDEVTATIPARLDLASGWSDTPPICLDQGGAVLNIAVELHGRPPIRTTVRRLAQPIIRCTATDGQSTEFHTTAELLAPPSPGCPFAIPRVALRMLGLLLPGQSLAQSLTARGGGLDITTRVDIPMGSGLGASSLLAVTTLRALAEMGGLHCNEAVLCRQTLRLEQGMTTGGGWQDQVGGIFPGAKLVTSRPGMPQHLHVHPIAWTAARQADFCARFLLYDTGIQRIAKGLLDLIVGCYLTRDPDVLRALRQLKTLAPHMAHAMRQGDWDRLGRLLDSHWMLNKRLNPQATNPEIDALLQRMRPHLSGAKLAGAGGGGFLLLLANSPADATALRADLSNNDRPGRLYEYRIAEHSLQVHTGLRSNYSIT